MIGDEQGQVCALLDLRVFSLGESAESATLSLVNSAGLFNASRFRLTCSGVLALWTRLRPALVTISRNRGKLHDLHFNSFFKEEKEERTPSIKIGWFNQNECCQ